MSESLTLPASAASSRIPPFENREGWGTPDGSRVLVSQSKLQPNDELPRSSRNGRHESAKELRENYVHPSNCPTQAKTALEWATRRDAVDAHFATSIHFAQLVKLYSSPDITGPDWMSAMSRVTGSIPSVRCGRPEPRFVSTSHLERLNLSVRMHLRRYARRTNAHSRKLANHKACVAIWVAWYKFVRVNSAIRMTPCMASGITTSIWTMRELLEAE